MFEKGYNRGLSNCPAYPGLTPSGALSTTAYWKFLRTDLHRGSCYEWVGFHYNPFRCDLTSCLSQSSSHADESLPPTHGFPIRHHINCLLPAPRREQLIYSLFLIFVITLLPLSSYVVMVLKGITELSLFPDTQDYKIAHAWFLKRWHPPLALWVEWC